MHELELREGGGNDERARCSRLVYGLLQKDQVHVPEGARGCLRYVRDPTLLV